MRGLLVWQASPTSLCAVLNSRHCNIVMVFAHAGPWVASCSTTTAKDWNMRLVMADDSFFSNASDWVFGSNGEKLGAGSCAGMTQACLYSYCAIICCMRCFPVMCCQMHTLTPTCCFCSVSSARQAALHGNIFLQCTQLLHPRGRGKRFFLFGHVHRTTETLNHLASDKQGMQLNLCHNISS